ncbi:MAG: 30S ribosomal protein S6 [Bacillota bacterium]|jgi:small subunit ribosomal protein S6|nr:30S ribosomal protein S6 [Bacillota bacterium]
MRKYEMLYIIEPDLDEEQVNSLQEKVVAIIAEQGGQVVETKQWGKRHLAYEIVDFKEGYYIELHFEGTPQVVDELDRVIKITDGILRHLIIREDE